MLCVFSLARSLGFETSSGRPRKIVTCTSPAFAQRSVPPFFTLTRTTGLTTTAFVDEERCWGPEVVVVASTKSRGTSVAPRAAAEPRPPTAWRKPLSSVSGCGGIHCTPAMDRSILGGADRVTCTVVVAPGPPCCCCAPAIVAPARASRKAPPCILVMRTSPIVWGGTGP